MRACFLGQNVTALGFGVAMLQTPPLREPELPKNPVHDAADEPQKPQPEDRKLPLPA